MRWTPVTKVLVTFVFYGHSGITSIAANGNAVRLTAKIDTMNNLPRAYVDNLQLAGRIGETLAGVDGHQGIWPTMTIQDRHRGRLPAYVNGAIRQGLPGIADVDETDLSGFAVSINQELAVLGGCNDFGHGLKFHVGVEKDWKGCEPLKSGRAMVGVAFDPCRSGKGCRRQGGHARQGQKSPIEGLHRWFSSLLPIR